jgi:hypothetical protein|tara:strand:- start:299 stop:1036 length:738 start_codon:yes stop_codon:yes gene_type:complete
VWQKLREEFNPRGFELVTVGMDTLGTEGCRSSIEAANPSHPSVIDQYHLLANQFGVVNIPSAIWIDERGMIVRPAEVAPAPPRSDDGITNLQLPDDLPQRMLDMMTEVAKMPSHSHAYHDALRDWVHKGSDSQFAMDPDQVIERSRPRGRDVATGQAHFEMASQLEVEGHHADAIHHFREAHRLVPDSWTFKRQAWSLEALGQGPLARFWQGPDPESPESWPYEGDWLSDVQTAGAQNYNDPWTP